MTATDMTKSQVTRCLRDAKSALENAANFCCEVDTVTDLPQAFTVVAKHISTMLETFTSIDNYFRSMGDGEEEQELMDMYPDIREVTRACCNDIKYLEDLFDTVKSNGKDDTRVKMKRYRLAVQDNDGKKVEKVMLDLLKGALLVALKPLVSDAHIQELEEAIREIKDLPPSLEDESMGGFVMNNSGPGNMFYHGGKGHQNICTGGFQVTGNNEHAVYRFAVKEEEGIKS
ncbi:hypothetical protein BBK36DRAFT_1161037 [Trichoderma citrinoviride]|uniref:NACHT-NTPase and P-loop NTPases N-terminal domain-containing protein n=1 Tax=Trichoderma citrinoviride TaxID=58853 RepID=A0A2T4B6Q0_9HYPO|nr:hypothetical protein BBK36DRAFT_1161037 [Trichoderma citrinoviride]PTB64881.1 hypothetical protein BBK36DRAFT_1161037 [Trichoderma citrinoviride]